MKRGFTKKCLRHNNFSLIVVFKIFFLILFFYSKPIVASNNCSSENNIKIGLIHNEFIDYQYYLYYELGNYAQENDIDFELGLVNKNIDEFDIIFGEFDELSKLFTTREISLPNQVTKYYNNNGLNISQNILPLDLDTFVLLSDKNIKIENFEDIFNTNNQFKYLFGTTYFSELFNKKLINYHLSNNAKFDHVYESQLNLQKKLFKFSNKNILEANYTEVYDSYKNKENVFTLFQDSIILYEKDIKEYQLMPQSIYKWNKILGYFEKKNKNIPYSFFGFSLYINNYDNYGFICHLIEKETRLNAFTKFNIQIGPLSSYEIRNSNLEISEDYLEFLDFKNHNIVDLNRNIEYEKFSLKEIKKDNYTQNFIINNYLN